MAKQLVLAIFDNQGVAEDAVESLRSGIADYSEIDLGPIGVLVVDEAGELKEHKMGQRSGGKGATIGLALAALTPVGLLAGVVGGAALGHFRQQGPGISAEDRARLAGELTGGKAALGVIVPAEKAALMTSILADLGGAPEVHEVTDEAVDAATAAATAAEADQPEA